MKKIFLSKLFLFPILLIAQNTNTFFTNPKISSVKVYLDGAEISRKGSMALKQGRNEIVLQNVSAFVNLKSVQFQLEEGLDLISIYERKKVAAQKKDNPQITVINDSIQLLYKNIVDINDETTALAVEKEMILKNQVISGEQTNFNLETLKQTAAYFHKRVFDINQRLTVLKRKSDAIQEEIVLKKERISLLSQEEFHGKKEITILLNVATNKSYALNVNYFTSNSGWSPIYDIKAKDIDNKIDVIYNAKVYNNTGNDWEDVDLILSTDDPTKSATRPYLSPWLLSYTQTSNRYQNTRNMHDGEGYTNSTLAVGDYDMEEASNAKAADKKAEVVIVKEDKLNKNHVNNTFTRELVEVPELGTEFIIDKKYSIPSDKKPYLINVTRHELAANYKHIAIPKVDRDAFLLAQITGWESLNLIEGTANVYFNKNYVGESYINTRYIEDTLDLSLGRDNKLLVTRTKKEDFNSKKFIGTNRKESFIYEIVVKNNRSKTVNLELQDQLPVSQESDINVEIMDISKAEHNELSGQLKWNMELAPGESKKFIVSFAVKYPKNRSVIIRKSRTVSRSKF